MKLIFLLIGLIVVSDKVFPQASDFISVKKRNNRTLKTYFPGVRIMFETIDKRGVDGEITAIRNDSIFVKEWDVRIVPTTLGVTVLDTVGVYINGFHYTEIYKIPSFGKMHFQQISISRLLIIGGAGYAALNIINGKYFNQSITDPENMKSLAIAAGAVGTGVLINFLRKHGDHNGGKYHVEYIHMNNGKKPLRGF